MGGWVGGYGPWARKAAVKEGEESTAWVRRWREEEKEEKEEAVLS